MVNITENKDYILVHVEGAKFNIEGILSKILDKESIMNQALDKTINYYKENY